MKQLVLLSVIIATFAMPAWLARRGSRSDYGAVLGPFAVFVALYVVLLLYVYPRLL